MEIWTGKISLLPPPPPHLNRSATLFAILNELVHSQSHTTDLFNICGMSFIVLLVEVRWVSQLIHSKTTYYDDNFLLPLFIDYQHMIERA